MSLGDKVLAFRSRGGGMGLILLARLWSPDFPESGETLLGRGESESGPGFFLTERSSGWSCTGLLLLSSMSDSFPTSISSSSETVSFFSMTLLGRVAENISENGALNI